MERITELKRTRSMPKEKSLEVVHKDLTGRVLRISKYLLGRDGQKPVSEMIFDSQGDSTLYMYSKTGEDVEKIIQYNP